MRHKYVILCAVLIGIFCKLVAKELSQPKSSPLSNENVFVVYYVFADQALEPLLKETMIEYLEKIGSVYSSDAQLSAKQKEEKYKAGGVMMNIIATPIVEENSSGAKELPVVEFNIAIRGGVEVLSNGSHIPCTIWENGKFISTKADQDEFRKKAVKTLRSMLDSFISDYKRANPAKKTQQPQFFLYS